MQYPTIFAANVYKRFITNLSKLFNLKCVYIYKIAEAHRPNARQTNKSWNTQTTRCWFHSHFICLTFIEMCWHKIKHKYNCWLYTWLPRRNITIAEPKAVRPHVNNVPNSACVTGPYPWIIIVGMRVIHAGHSKNSLLNVSQSIGLNGFQNRNQLSSKGICNKSKENASINSIQQFSKTKTS